ncbi:MAG: hypothetical protein HN576_02300 [Bacteriovoracaceae bacterium]|nr:hypothetical protein [Bacteriovoracaceae bacterium]
MTAEQLTNISCFACQKDTGISLESKISRTEECPLCYASLRCCRMCKFYDQSAYNECHETQAARILEKEKSNFCDFFILNGVGETPCEAKDKSMSAANALFKK